MTCAVLLVSAARVGRCIPGIVADVLFRGVEKGMDMAVNHFFGGEETGKKNASQSSVDWGDLVKMGASAIMEVSSESIRAMKDADRTALEIALNSSATVTLDRVYTISSPVASVAGTGGGIGLLVRVAR